MRGFVEAERPVDRSIEGETMTTVHAYAAREAGGPLEQFEYELPGLGPNEVDIAVSHCGICHSDLSMLQNDWGMTQYPFVPGHEVVGRVEAVGELVRNVQVGDVVGLGWFSGSCLCCEFCLRGDQNLCLTAEQTIVGRHGGFADRIRTRSEWAVRLPEGLDQAKAGPLFCGGVTVFNPIVQNGITATSRVGVVGIGGLGHMALQFLNHWGCEVTAFSTSPDKANEARSLGADHFVATRDASTFERLVGAFDMIIVTVNVDLPWDSYIQMLRPRGVLHLVGAAHQVTATVFPMLQGQRSIKGSPLGSPATTAAMLDFAARHGITPVVESFPFDRVNDAMETIRSGRPRYRVVLTH